MVEYREDVGATLAAFLAVRNWHTDLNRLYTKALGDLAAAEAALVAVRAEHDDLYDVMEAQLVNERDSGELTEAAFHRLRHLLLIGQRGAAVSSPGEETP
jgi:hypothetical protein